MTHNCELIVLSLTKTGDNAAVVHTLSREWGRRSFLISVSKGSPMSLFLPLNILEADIVENPKSSLWRARNICALHPLYGIRNDIRKNTMTLFMSEVLFRAIKEGTEEPGLYDWCMKSILTLDAIKDDFANFHLRFLMELCSAMGFALSAEGIMPFAGEHYAALRKMLELSFSESMLLPLRGEDRNAMADILLKYLSYHTESAINVRSLSVLREIYL